MSLEYWILCVEQSLEDQGIVANAQQIEAIAADMDKARDLYSMGTGIDCIPNPLEHQNQELRKKITSFEDEVSTRIKTAREEQKRESYWEGYREGKRDGIREQRENK